MNPYNLLIVEDDKLTSDSLQKWFGFQVNVSGGCRWNIDTAFDGREALYKIKNNKYDAVILDLQLPEINGKDLLFQCKDELINVCTVIFTSHKEILSLEEACELNVFSYFLKSEYQPVQIELSLIRGIELKQIEQICSKNTALVNLSREVCHDIKNYLHPIIGFAEMFEMSGICGDQHQCQVIMKHIQSSANTIKNLSNELYLFSGCLLNQENQTAKPLYDKLECLSSSHNTSSLNANTILNVFKEVIQEFSKLYKDRITFIDNLYLNGEIKVKGNAFQLERIFRNIIKNAVEAVTENCNQGFVEIRSSLEKNCFVIYISDTGPGFAKEIQENMFQPSYTTKENGSGMGLYICKRLINNCGGDICIKNDEPGNTTMAILLPFAQTTDPFGETEYQRQTLL